jgi:hypothetical protein
MTSAYTNSFCYSADFYREHLNFEGLRWLNSAKTKYYVYVEHLLNKLVPRTCLLCPLI